MNSSVSKAPTVWTEDEAKRAILKFDVIIDMANTAGADITQTKASLVQALTAFEAGDMNTLFGSMIENTH
jgi:hypothetical protein